MGGMVGVGGVAGSCAGELYTAKQDPAALLFVLDRSVSMYGTKWQALSEAVTQAMDSTEFDTMFVGFLAAPWGDTAAPQCVVDASGGLITQIPCMAPTDPQIPLTLVGTQPTTDSTSFRAQVKSVLSGSGPKMPDPFGFDPDSSPLYPAIQNALKALKAWPETGKRILVIISDGSIDCNQGSGRPGYPDGNGCTTDWEDPNNIVKLVKDANMDPTTPIQSFVVGVPGADTYDASGANFPPYHMRLALSAIAAAGAPDYVDPTCDGMTYTQSGGDPTKSCHFDMTQGAFTSDTLAKNLAAIRNETLGCAFNLPMPTNGMIVDPTEVNVEVDTGMGLIEVPKRKDPMDTCPDNPCWDYDQNGKVVLIGQECAALKNAQNPQVSIVVGCATIEKP